MIQLFIFFWMKELFWLYSIAANILEFVLVFYRTSGMEMKLSFADKAFPIKANEMTHLVPPAT